MNKEKKTEQLAMKVTPSVMAELEEKLKKLGCPLDDNGQVKVNQEALVTLMHSADMTAPFNEHPNYAEDVATIDQYTAIVRSNFVSLIDKCETAEARIRTEFEAQLESNNNLIIKLQEEVKTMKEEKKKAITDAEESKRSQVIMEKNLAQIAEKLTKAEESVSDKSNYIDLMQTKLVEAEKNLKGYEALKASEKQCSQKLMELQHEKEIVLVQRSHEQNQLRAIESKLTETEKKCLATNESLSELNRRYASLKQELEDEKSKNKDTVVLLQESAKKEQAAAVELAVTKERAKAKEITTSLKETITSLQEEKASVEMRLDSLQKELDSLKRKAVSEKKSEKVIEEEIE